MILFQLDFFQEHLYIYLKILRFYYYYYYLFVVFRLFW